MKNLLHPRGYALATILILLGVSMFSAAAIVGISTLESKIANSQREGIRAYYVAESGVQAALWQLTNNNLYNATLLAGTINVNFSYTSGGTTFTVTITQTPGQTAGNATIDVIGQATSGSITAKRRIIAYAYAGSGAAPTGTNAMLAGANINLSNGGADISITGGHVHSNTNVAVNNARVNLNGGWFKAVGNYTQNPNPSGNIVYGGINATNYAPADTVVTVPLFDFAAARSAAQGTGTYYATAAAFRSAYPFGSCSATSVVNLPGPVTFIDQSLTLDNCYRNKTINVTGQLVIGNGGLNVNTNASDLVVNINPDSSGKSGLFVQQNINNNRGTWTVNGVYYSLGTMAFGNSGNFTVNGAVITNADLVVNNNYAMNIAYTPGNVTGSFGGGSPAPVLVRHWEEEY